MQFAVNPRCNQNMTHKSEIPFEPINDLLTEVVDHSSINARIVRSYTCRVCEKQFSTAAALGGHIRVHEPRHYSIGNCDKTFATRKGAVDYKIKTHRTSP